MKERFNMAVVVTAVVVIVAFVLFIGWARTTSGRAALRGTLGDPQGFGRRASTLKRKSSTKRSRR